MIRKTLLNLMLVLMLVPLMAFVMAGASGSVLAQDVVVQSESGIQATAGTAFTYQGRLIWNGTPVDGGPCIIDFSLWTAETGGQQIGSTIHQVVNPGNGYFTVSLDFGAKAFNGSERWLQMSPSCDANPGPTLSRIKLTAAPYALSLVPGAVTADTSGNNVGLYAQSGPDWNLPLLIATKLAGLWGDSRFNDGVIGTSQQGNGVYGYSETGKAVYADGDAHVEGQLTWKPLTSYLSIPGSAFAPQFSSYQYHFSSIGSTLIPDDISSFNYLAPVQLPHGATVTEFTFFWTDSSNEDGSAALFRIDLQGGEVEMARAETHGGSSGGGGGSTVTGSSSDTSIDFAVIDNSQYAYYVWLRLPMDSNGATVDAHGVTIRYTIDRPH